MNGGALPQTCCVSIVMKSTRSYPSRRQPSTLFHSKHSCRATMSPLQQAAPNLMPSSGEASRPAGGRRRRETLQISLFAQLPRDIGGLSSSACYITITDHLQTMRMILEAHPLSSSFCVPSDIQTVQTPTIPRLVHISSRNTSVPRARSRP